MRFDQFLQELCVINCHLSASQAYFLSYALEYNHNLERLFLSNNQINDRGALLLGEVAMSHRSLTTLGFSYNGITDSCLEKICGTAND